MSSTAEDAWASKGGWSRKSKSKVSTAQPVLFESLSDGKKGTLLFFGVILPILAVVFESNCHFCAQNFFDPFPSPSHVVLFLLIPLSNFLAYASSSKNMSSHYAFMSLASGMAMGMAFMYSLMFLPLVGRSLLYSLYLGFGLLGLSPILALPCLWGSGKLVAHLAAKQKTYFNAHQVEHMGHLIVLVMVLAVELPSTMTRVQMEMASKPETAVAAYRWLRRYGSEEILLRACYERSGRATDILGSLYEATHPMSVAEARNIFYRTTGKPFNSVAIPASARATIKNANAIADPAGLNAGVVDEFDLDTDIAGEAVSGVARGLSVSASKLSGKLDANAMVADLDWSFSFKNVSKYDREARSKILLPQGAVVTKATLTVNNVEHDATIMVREEARKVYQQAVMQHKEDPLLVSTCGIDQILVQCFPVHPDAALKVKLKIITPLSANGNGSASLMMPVFMERNFQVESATAVDIESGGKHLQGNFENEKIAKFAAFFHVDRDPNLNKVYCEDKDSSPARILERDIAAPQIPKPKKLSVIIDGSIGMKDALPSIIEGLKSVPNDVPTELILVADESRVLCSAATIPGSSAFATALGELQKYKAAGGQSDFSALSDYLVKRSKDGGSVALWVHAAQPALGEAQSIKQLLGSEAKAPIVYDLQVAAGPNDILDGVENFAGVARVPQNGDLSSSLRQFFLSWTNEKLQQQAEYLYHDASFKSEEQGKYAAPAAMAKLAAYNRVLLDLANPLTSPANEANELARDYHLVTPISSAVVVDDIPEMAAVVLPPVPHKDFAAQMLTDAREAVESCLRDFDGFVTPCVMGISNLPSLISNAGNSIPMAISQSFQSTVNQLNNLNSVRSPSAPTYGGGGSYSGSQTASLSATESQPSGQERDGDVMSGGDAGMMTSQKQSISLAEEKAAAKPSVSGGYGDIGGQLAENKPNAARSQVVMRDHRPAKLKAAVNSGFSKELPPVAPSAVAPGEVSREKTGAVSESSRVRQADKVSLPLLSGATNGTVSPQGFDATSATGAQFSGNKKQAELNKNEVVETDAFVNEPSKERLMLDGETVSGGNELKDATVIQGVNTAGIVRSNYNLDQQPLKVAQRLLCYLLMLGAVIAAFLYFKRSKSGLFVRAFLATLIILSSLPISVAIVTMLAQGIQ